MGEDIVYRGRKEGRKEGREEGRKRRGSESRKDGFIKKDLDGG